MNPTQNNNPISIGTLNSQQTQVGNQNTINVNVTPQELLDMLTKLTEKKPEEQKTIIQKISQFVSDGTGLGEVLVKLAQFL